MRTERSLVLVVEDHELRGVRVRGRWSFWSRSWPALAQLHEGDESPDEMVNEFMARALGVEPAPFAETSGGVSDSSCGSDVTSGQSVSA